MSELHIIIPADGDEVTTLVAAVQDALGERTMDWHEHAHENNGGGGEVIGWNVLVTVSHPTHADALSDADEFISMLGTGADVELQPVIGIPPGGTP